MKWVANTQGFDEAFTFTVDGEKDGIERIFPFDFVPRILTAREIARH